MKATKLLFTFLSGVFLFSSCLKDSGEVTTLVYTPEQLQVLQANLDLDDELIDYSVKLPNHIAARGASTSQINNHKALLGRVLFYDNKLSRNDAVNCSSCHDQARAFADPVDFSKGFDGEHTKRNSLALGAVVSFEASYDSPGSPVSKFFWDERANSIAEQSELTIEDNIEMGMSFDDLTEKLQGEAYYEILFEKAYGSSQITKGKITDALEEFVNSLVSADSKFDRAVADANGSTHSNLSKLTQQENLGKSLYHSNCADCHGHDLVSLGRAVANNGLDTEYADKGRYEVTGFNQDKGIFKVPVLRNIELTGPYMHDGRFDTLEEVVDHYSEGIQNHPNLDFSLRQGFDNNAEPRQMNFSDDEKAALVAFLKTLTDFGFVSNEKFADPFK